MSTPEKFTNATEAAHWLGVPEAWLRREAKAGNVPHLRADRRLLLDLEQVAQALAKRAEAGRSNCEGVER